MRHLLVLLFSTVVVDARVTFAWSEILDDADLRGPVNTMASFRCSRGCRVFSTAYPSAYVYIIDSKGKYLMNIADLYQLLCLNDSPCGYELPGGDYSLKSTQIANPKFIFYAVEKGAANYGSKAIPVPGNNFLWNGHEGPTTFMSSSGVLSFEFIRFKKGDPLPFVTAAGFDSIEYCLPVFSARSLTSLNNTVFSVYSPIATIYFKGDNPEISPLHFYYQITTTDKPSTIIQGASAVFTSPGYVGCPSVGDSLYSTQSVQCNPYCRDISSIESYAYLSNPNGLTTSIYTDFSIANKDDAISLTVNNDVMSLYGKETGSKTYESKDLNIRLLWNQNKASKDGFAMQIDVISNELQTTTVRPLPTTTTRAAPITASTIPPGQNAYCNCELDKYGLPIGWNFNDIWVDIVVIVDASEAMGKDTLQEAGDLIESFISDGVDEFLVTDTTDAFYSRVGVISMADTATTIFDLNMTRFDTMKGKETIKTGVKEIDVLAAFNAAMKMLNDDQRKTERANARKVIYYMTDSDPKSNLDSLKAFKENGVIVVNNFVKFGEVERSSLKALASEGYYFSNGDYDTAGLQAFCKANCFCGPDKIAYQGSDPAVKVGGGCYHVTPTGVPFNKAKSTCADGDGILAAIHDEQKGIFLQTLMRAVSTKDYFWFGYEKSDDGTWTWEDGSSDPWTNWDADEPSDASVARCGYGMLATENVTWGAGNCAQGFPYICQYPPCAAGKKDC